MKKLCALICALALLIAGAAQASDEAYLEAYREALENLYYNQTFPDGDFDGNANPELLEDNGFAVYDVDGDGRRELIIEWSGTATASYRGFVYDYDEATGSLRAEFDGGINLIFYDNGMLEAPLSHNQGPSEYFWPYFLYQYVPERDAYESRGDVYAVEKDAYQEFGEEFWGFEFPEYADADGNGTAYSISDGDWVDDDVYEQWRMSFAGEGREMRIPYVSLTLENIRDMR